ALLDRAGKGDYWDDVDSLVRNQMVENQLTDSSFLSSLAETIPNPIMAAPAAYDGTKQVGARLIGGFASYASLNDYFNPLMHAPGPIVGCCTGNGARALYYVWERILQERHGALYVNLLLNRASDLADIDSFIPYSGRVDVRMKRSMRLWVRLPGWVDTSQVNCTVEEQPLRVEWKGRYASPGRVEAGKVASFRFPIRERSEQLTIGGVEARLVFRGSTVVDIDPKGKYAPLYRGREKYRTGQARMKMVQRFVPSKTIEW
ncbi:MAG: hypothetical protein ACRD2X_07035, partial [Vicinamibacteraceae bacterium]